MGQVANLKRVKRASFKEVEETKKYPRVFEEEVDVDKLWEPIMYVLGEGFLGKAPIFNLFIPGRIIVTYKDEYMTEGIRYHDTPEIKELHDFIASKSIEDLIAKVNIEKMNKKVMYSVVEADISEIRQYIVDIKECFRKALDSDQVIIASIG